MSDKKISLPLSDGEESSGDTTHFNPAATASSRADGGDVMSEIRKEISAHPVVLYMKGTMQQPMCGFSARAAAILGSYGVDVYSVNVLADPEKRQAIKDFSDWPTIPQCYIGGEFVGGSDLLSQMYESGQLDDLIKPYL